jgi:cytochrome P450
MLAASWLIVFLGNHPSWRSKIVSELSDLLAHGTSDSSPLTERLGSVSLEDWESRTPMLDAAIRETLRLAQPHVAMRKNVSTADIPLPGGQVIPPGAFAVYPFADVHLDESLYPNPWAWNPARLEPSGQAMAYIGWGGGTQPPHLRHVLLIDVLHRQDRVRRVSISA